ncbi:MAG: hypothetical protein ACXWOL_05290 [Ktedonobacteraceae bacterium]
MTNEYNDKLQPFPTEEERQEQLLQRYRQRQEMQRRTIPVPGRPEREPGDIRTWWGGKRESSALQRHHARMDGIYHAARQAGYTQEWVLALEYFGFATAMRTVAAEERELLETDPNSLTGQIAEQMLLDSADRIRIASTDIQEDFRRKTLGSS